jgi:hypothetical protein
MKKLSVENSCKDYIYKYDGKNVTKQFNKVLIIWENGEQQTYDVEWEKDTTIYTDLKKTWGGVDYVIRYFLVITILHNGSSIKLNLQDNLNELTVLPIF